MHLCDKTAPDIIMFGSQSSTIAANLYDIRYNASYQLDVLLGYNPDAVVLVVNRFDGIDYIRKTIRFIESASQANVVCIVVSFLENPDGFLKLFEIAEKAHALGFNIFATKGTANAIFDVPITRIKKVSQGTPNIKEAILDGKIDMIINTPHGEQASKDGYTIRRLAIELGIPYVTTLAGARAALNAIEAVKENELKVKSLNDHIANI